jgi:hypothetical protein
LHSALEHIVGIVATIRRTHGDVAWRARQHARLDYCLGESVVQVAAKVQPGLHCVAWVCLGSTLTIVLLTTTGLARAEDNNAAKGASDAPDIYLDVRTTYAKVPAGSLAIGFDNSGLFTALQSAAISGSAGLPATGGGGTLPAAQSVVTDLPLTVDVTDNVSLYAGVSASSTNTLPTGWSPAAITSWNVGFQADVYNQNGGSIPTLTWQSTITQAIPNGPLGTTTFNNVFEFDYALDKDETRGLLAGVQDTRVVGTQLVTIHPDIIGYVGGYYQWQNNWKLTGRVGVQAFGGAQLLNFVSVPSFTQPTVRLDIDRMDDNDNRLFGVTGQIIWMPQPAYQLTLRTPLYLARD